MARVLLFSNFLQPGEQSVLAPTSSDAHSYETMTPGRWRANPYRRSKHMSLGDAVRRAVGVLHCAIRARGFDVLILDSLMSALPACLYLHPFRRPRVVVWSFNVPRRREGLARLVVRWLLRRADLIIVHGTYDIGYAGSLYAIPPERFRFLPFMREFPNLDTPPESPWGTSPYVISYGGNARDYRSLIEAVRGQPVNLLIVAREYNLEGIELPDNVKALFNIPLPRCDTLVRDARFVVFTLDGSEPSCGQISMVTAFMLGKPVIATRCTGTEDYIAEGVNGEFVELGEVDEIRRKVMRLWSDDDALRRLSGGAEDWADRHMRPDVIHREVEDIVNSVVGSSP